MKIINISLNGLPSDYNFSLVPKVIQKLGYKIQWTNNYKADLIIYGPFFRKSLRHKFFFNSKNKISLFQTAENIRHDFFKTDYSISFDMNVNSSNHFRFPYWMESLDWSHEGIASENIRFGMPVKIERLMKPLGSFYTKNFKAAFFTSHLREPRYSLLNELNRIINVDGYGPFFDKNIKNHNSSDFTKFEILNKYAFNFCPENSIFPGYFTEKIVESFAGCSLPITWVDPNVRYDFNPRAFINLHDYHAENFSSISSILHSKSSLKEFAEQPLLLSRVELFPLFNFIKRMLTDVMS